MECKNGEQEVKWEPESKVCLEVWEIISHCKYKDNVVDIEREANL